MSFEFQKISFGLSSLFLVVRFSSSIAFHLKIACLRAFYIFEPSFGFQELAFRVSCSRQRFLLVGRGFGLLVMLLSSLIVDFPRQVNHILIVFG